jgi:hypothetical protein
MFEAGIVDPVRVTYTALANAASVATLILTTETLIGDLAEDEDPTTGPALLLGEGLLDLGVGGGDESGVVRAEDAGMAREVDDADDAAVERITDRRSRAGP